MRRDRAGDVPGHRIDRLDIAPETLNRARIKHCRRAISQACRDFGRIDLHIVPPARREAKLLPMRRRARCQRMPGCYPPRQSAVEHRDPIVARPIQHPPQSARRRLAHPRVVGHDLCGWGDPPSRQRVHPVVFFRQRVPAGLAWHMRAGQLVIQAGEKRARKMARLVVASALAPVAQGVTAIDKEPVRIGDPASCVDD